MQFFAFMMSVIAGAMVAEVFAPMCAGIGAGPTAPAAPASPCSGGQRAGRPNAGATGQR
jgi:hypothetical protein